MNVHRHEFDILVSLEQLYPRLKPEELIRLAPLLIKKLDYKANSEGIECTEFLPPPLSNYLLENVKLYRPDLNFSIDSRYSRN